MTAAERLNAIEAWASELGDASSGPPEQFEAAEYICDLTSALRAVLDLLDGRDLLAAVAGKGEGRIPTSTLRLVIDAALGVTS